MRRLDRNFSNTQERLAQIATPSQSFCDRSTASVSQSALVSAQILKNMPKLTDWAKFDEWIESADGVFEGSDLPFRDILQYTVSKLMTHSRASVKASAASMSNWGELKAYLTRTYSKNFSELSAASNLNNMRQDSAPLQDYIDKFRQQARLVCGSDDKVSTAVLANFIAGVRNPGVRNKLISIHGREHGVTLARLCTLASEQEKTYKTAQNMTDNLRMQNTQRPEVRSVECEDLGSESGHCDSVASVAGPEKASVVEASLKEVAEQFQDFTSEIRQMSKRLDAGNDKSAQRAPKNNTKWCSAHQTNGHDFESCKADRNTCPRCKNDLNGKSFDDHYKFDCSVVPCGICGLHSHRTDKCYRINNQAAGERQRGAANGAVQTPRRIE